MKKSRIALLIGVLSISLFPVIVAMKLTSGLTSAFYRMAIAATGLLSYVAITRSLKVPSVRVALLAALCGILFAADIAFWNLSIQLTTATQGTLLTNLAPIWVGVIAFLFLKNKPRSSFWFGTLFAMAGIAVFIGVDIFLSLSFDQGFIMGIFSGFFYALYILLSKEVLNKMEVVSFITISSVSSALFLLIINIVAAQPLWGFSTYAWISLLIQGLVSQLLAWLLISYATKRMRATRLSLSLLSQVVFASILAWFFLGEVITIEKAIGGVLILVGIAITFYEKKEVRETYKKL
ncbi:MAG: DMT family transporter [Bacteroidales bacterium]|nr:DMT family transporter [Bacteroidales bacterium]